MVHMQEDTSSSCVEAAQQGPGTTAGLPVWPRPTVANSSPAAAAAGAAGREAAHTCETSPWTPVASGAGACRGHFSAERSGADGGHCKGTDRLGLPSHTPHRAWGGTCILLASVSLSSRSTENIPRPLPSLQPVIPAPVLASLAQQAMERRCAHDAAHPAGAVRACRSGGPSCGFSSITRSPWEAVSRPRPRTCTARAALAGPARADPSGPCGRTLARRKATRPAADRRPRVVP